MRKFIIKAYQRNIRAACAAMGKRVPQGYTTAIATNGDFVVYDSGMRIIGRLAPGSFQPFTKSA